MFSCFPLLGSQPSEPLLQIRLENPSRTFTAGETIIGEIILLNDKPKQLKNIRIIFKGKAKVQLTRGSGRQTRHYVAEEKYLFEEVILLGNEHENILLQPGRSTFPFSYRLPLNIPSSFASFHGNIEYSMEAAIKRPWYKLDVRTPVPFTVRGVLDLNLERGLLNCPMKVQKRKWAFDLLCRGGPVEYSVQLPRLGWIPGENLTFKTEISNLSGIKIKSVKALLVKRISFWADGMCKQEETVVSEIRGPKVFPAKTEIWNGSMFLVSLLPTKFGGCKIIDLQYVLIFRVKSPILKLFSVKMDREVPLTIGTISFRNNTPYTPANLITSSQNYTEIQNVRTGGINSWNGFQPISTNYYSPIQPAIEDCPFDDPPTYEDAISNQNRFPGWADLTK